MLVWEGSDANMSGVFYVAVVQSLFIFLSDMWLVMSHIRKVFDSPHNLGAQRISCRVPWRQINGIWVYLPIGEYFIFSKIVPVIYCITR